jgi:hypothetical protein
MYLKSKFESDGSISDPTGTLVGLSGSYEAFGSTSLNVSLAVWPNSDLILSGSSRPGN